MTYRQNTFVIAEAGVNHNGSIELAKKLIDVAAKAKADAVKFQTFKAESLVSPDATKAEYQKITTGGSESQFAMIKKLELTATQYKELSYCLEKGIQFLSTPFDLESLKLLTEEIQVPLIKIASGEITNSQLLLAAARTEKPIILSTGMSEIQEIKQALGVLAFGYLSPDKSPSSKLFNEIYENAEARKILQEKVTLLQCTTAYPCPPEDAFITAMDELKSVFNLKIGYSDHTTGIIAPIAAVARGAVLIEKHFTLQGQWRGQITKPPLSLAN